MVADSGKIDAISGVPTSAITNTVPVSEGVSTPSQKPAVKHIDMIDSESKTAPASLSVPVTELSYTTVPFQPEESFNTNQNGDCWKLGLCKNDMEAVKKNATNNIKYMTVSAMSQKAKPVVSVINDDFSFGSKNNYAVANCNISLQDLKSSEGINRYFSVLAMPSSHGHTFRASTENEPMYTLVVTNRETGKVLSGNELDNFYKFAEQTIQVENNAQQSA